MDQMTVNNFDLYLKTFKSLRKMLPIANPQFNLLYRGSKDGFTASAFHAKVDGQGPTLIMIKSEFGKRFGAYVSKGFSSTKQDVEDEKARLFSLNNDMCLQPCYFLKKTLTHDPAALVVLGNQNDLVIVDNCNQGGCKTWLGSK